MARVIWRPVAESDLDDILFYIAVVDRSPTTGEPIYSEIRDKLYDHVQKSCRGINILPRRRDG
jgi:plasmid stabilization system protein ParE